jgi:hypothetical protein
LIIVCLEHRRLSRILRVIFLHRRCPACSAVRPKADRLGLHTSRDLACGSPSDATFLSSSLRAPLPRPERTLSAPDIRWREQSRLGPRGLCDPMPAMKNHAIPRPPSRRGRTNRRRSWRIFKSNRHAVPICSECFSTSVQLRPVLLLALNSLPFHPSAARNRKTLLCTKRTFLTFRLHPSKSAQQECLLNHDDNVPFCPR